MSDLPGNPDVVIVGAGAAGIGAGLALARQGVPFVILEAKDRVGGRAHTDTSSVGHLWDHGCHWFHSADRNPLRMIADRIGHGYHPVQRGATAPMFAGGRWEMNGQARLHIWAELDRIAACKEDVPADSVIDATDPLAPMVRHWVSLMSSGEPRDVSARDYGRYDDSHVNLPVRDGYGALIRRLSAGLPIRLSTPVTRIALGPRGCAVETPAGTLEPKAVIVAVSVNVLNSGIIGFEPALPAELASALEDVPCGSYEKIVIAFEGNPFADFEAEFCDILDPPGSHPMNIEVAPFGRPIAIGHVAGDYARELGVAGQAALIDVLKEKLVSAFGGGIVRHISRTATTTWGSDPYIRGGYAYALAGKAASRDVMIQADVSPIFLAGEAFHPTWGATAHGAYLTGLDAATKACRHIGVTALTTDPLWLPDWVGVPAAAQ